MNDTGSICRTSTQWPGRIFAVLELNLSRTWIDINPNSEYSLDFFGSPSGPISAGNQIIIQIVFHKF
jgi:hypothetical protein